MRVIGGFYRSRSLKMVGLDTTRETTDKVRGAIFNLISLYQIKGNVLDLFAGSGAMGIEALSRGAHNAYFNDLNHKAYLTIKDNLSSLGLNHVGFVSNLDYRQYLQKCKTKFDFVFLDPPYALNVCADICEEIIQNDLLTVDGLIICEVEQSICLTPCLGLEVYKERNYGIRKIVIFRRAKDA